jgi:hypothetical protein
MMISPDGFEAKISRSVENSSLNWDIDKDGGR